MDPQQVIIDTLGPQPSVSVVIPVFGAARVLAGLVEEIATVLGRHGFVHEIVLVNDASPDESWSVITDVSARHDCVVGVNLMRNFGQHNALLCGVRLAKHDIIVTMDDDFQHPPDELPRLLAALTPDVDVVYGTPREQQWGFLRGLASTTTKIALQSTMGAETARMVSAFRAFRREVSDAFALYQGPYVSIDVLLTWGTTRFTAIPVRHEPRKVGRSNYSFFKLVNYALNMMTGFSTVPLQFASFIGFGFTIGGLAILVYVVGEYFLEGSTVAGFPFLASIVAIFSGAQLFALGIMGEYLARMHFRMMDRPTYAIRETTLDD